MPNIINLLLATCGETQHKNKKGKGKGCFGKKDHNIPIGEAIISVKRKHISHRKQIKRLKKLKEENEV